MSQCQVINFPSSNGLYQDEFDSYKNTILSDEDILNLLVGVTNLIKRYATQDQLELLIDRLDDVRDDLIQDFI